MLIRMKNRLDSVWGSLETLFNAVTFKGSPITDPRPGYEGIIINYPDGYKP